jgi:prepilin-type processing-associated H-X9-DG protein
VGDWNINDDRYKVRLHASYCYLGWVMDRVEDIPANNAPIASFPLIKMILTFDVPTEGDVPIQHARGLEVAGQNILLSNPPNPDGVSQDIVNVDFPQGSQTFFGNGGGTTIYRLKEGVERFMITDINNPAATARAQSEIFVMFDMISTVTGTFNHVPGGANVLWMDGHVEFVKYPGRAPITATAARVVGCFPQ